MFALNPQNKMKKIISLWLFLIIAMQIQAQKRILRMEFNDGNSYIQANIRGQFWARYGQYNPGSTINAEPIDDYLDFSLRRFRIGMQTNLGGKFYILSQIGGNSINQNSFNSFKLQLIDLYGEYRFSKFFALGAGKSIWGSPNRISSYSNGNMLNLDELGFSIFTINKQDDSGRNLGIFAKGQINRFDYRLALSAPPLIKETSYSTEHTNYAVNTPHKRYSGYVKYHFWDTESNDTPFSVGTYLGKKDILNLGVGGQYQADMMQIGSKENHKNIDFKNISADVFLEKKLSEHGEALTTYLGYFYTNFGKNYVRNTSSNDIADTKSGTTLNGKGFQQPNIGTGHTIFFSMGYLLPKSKHSEIRIQPNFAIRYADFEGLKSPVYSYESGVNVYLNGSHTNKLCLGYSNRPIFDVESKKVVDRKNMLVLQYQFEIK